MPMSSSQHDKFYAAIKETYFQLERNFDKIYQQCKNDTQRNQLRDIYSAARDAFWKATAERLEDANSVVRSIHTELKTANTKMKAALRQLQDIVAFLKLATETVRLAASLAALAAV